jgi:hypothetical protein
MVSVLKRSSLALILVAATTAPTRAQDIATSPNQTTANAVAASLRSSRALAGYRIEIEAQSGVITLTGSVATQAQKAEAIARAQQVAGVATVADRLQVAGDNRVRPAQYQLALGRRRRQGDDSLYDGAPMMTDGAAIANDGPVPEGLAAGMPGAGGSAAAATGLPNYAWPSYAPYPNFSAVGYPTAYPWQAWPNIGPFYPYPEVPLDWRAVTLRWDDGIWWLDFKKNYTRPFFTPYPFGIHAY